MYEIFEHTADLGLRVSAPDLPTLLSEAGRGLFSLIIENLEEVRSEQTITLQINCESDPSYLLFDWLNELLFIFESNHLLLVEFQINLTDQCLSAVAKGERFDPTRHRPDHEVKAITYHGLKVAKMADGYLAEVIVDI